MEMAYIGDPQVSQKIIEASKRGIKVRILFSENANIGNDINYRSLYRIYKQCETEVYLSEKMLHSKLFLIDDQTVITGSANTSVFSMQKANELDLVIKDEHDVIESIRQTIEHRIQRSKKVASLDQLKNYNGVIACMQQLHQFIH